MLVRLLLLALALVASSLAQLVQGSDAAPYVRRIRYPAIAARPFGYGNGQMMTSQHIVLPSQNVYDRYGGNYGPGLLTGMLLGR
ncbi:unnamed protein product, partial [Mesorhabditis spiculigera]